MARVSYAAGVRILFVIAFACAACRDPDVQRLEEVKAAVCACKTPACADDAMKVLPGAPQSAKPSHRAQQVAQAMLDCLAKIRDLNDRGSAAAASPGTP